MELNKKQRLILGTATKLFMEHGYKDVSIMDIAHTANVSQVTLYKYFENKFHLAEAVWVDIITRSYDSYLKEMDGDKHTFQEIFGTIIKDKQKAIGNVNTDFYDFLINELKIVDSPIRLAYDSQKKEFYKKFIEIGRKAQMIKPDLTDESLILYLDMIVSYFQNSQISSADAALIQREHKNLLYLLFYGFLK